MTNNDDIYISPWVRSQKDVEEYIAQSGLTFFNSIKNFSASYAIECSIITTHTSIKELSGLTVSNTNILKIDSKVSSVLTVINEQKNLYLNR